MSVTLLLVGGNSFDIEHDLLIAQIFSDVFDAETTLFAMTLPKTTENPMLGAPLSWRITGQLLGLYRRALRHSQQHQTEFWVLAFSAGALFAAETLRQLSPRDLPDHLAFVASCFSLRSFLPFLNPPCFGEQPFEAATSVRDLMLKANREVPWVWVLHSQSDDLFPNVDHYFKEWPKKQYVQVDLGRRGNQLNHVECCWNHRALRRLLRKLRRTVSSRSS